MPTYSYACTACDHRFDAVQSFSDESLSVCPECGGRLRKVFNAVGVVFKGGGFYRTDSRSGSSASVPAANGSGSGSGSGDSGSSDAGSGSGDSSSSSAPAKTTAAAAKSDGSAA